MEVLTQLTRSLVPIQYSYVVKKYSTFVFLVVLISLSSTAFAQTSAEITWPTSGQTIDANSPVIYFNSNDAVEMSFTLGTSPGQSDLYSGSTFLAANIWEHTISNVPTNGQQVYLTFRQKMQGGAWTQTALTYITLDDGIDKIPEKDEKNLAPLGTASQSTTAYQGAAPRAIDGLADGMWSSRSVTHTSFQTNPWWEVALADNAEVSRVVLHDRIDNCCTSRLQNVYVFLSETPFNNTDTIAQLKATKQYEYIADVDTNTTVSITGTARFVRVQLDQNGALSLAEVEVFGVETQPSPLPTPTPSPSTPTNDGAFTKENLLAGYRGAFKLPADKNYFTEFYGANALAVSSDGKHLFMMGFGKSTGFYPNGEPGSANGAPVLTKLEIPNGNLSALPTARLVQELDLNGRLQTDPKGSNVSPAFAFQGFDPANFPAIVVDDLIESDGKLIGSAYVGYDAEGQASHSHFVVDNLDLNSANVRGLFNIAEQFPSSLVDVDGTDAGFVAGYMTEVPNQWREKLGGFTHLGGQGGLSIISRTNAGPGAFLFNASEIEQSSNSVLPLTHYPDESGLRLGFLLTPLDSRGVSTVNDDTALFNINSTVEGVFFAPDTDSVVFIGTTGSEGENTETARTYYGGEDDYSPTDIHRAGKGTHSLGGRYEYQAWVYNVEQYARVIRNEVSPQARTEPESYFRFRFGADAFGDASKARRLGGVSLHQSSGTLYVTEKLKNQAAVVHVFDLQR